MENPIPKFRQSPIIFKKPGYFSEKLKNLLLPEITRVERFLLKLCTCFLVNKIY